MFKKYEKLNRNYKKPKIHFKKIVKKLKHEKAKKFYISKKYKINLKNRK